MASATSGSSRRRSSYTSSTRPDPRTRLRHESRRLRSAEVLVPAHRPPSSIYAHPVTVGDRADHRPCVGKVDARREGGCERVVLSPSEHPDERVDVECGADLAELCRDVDALRAQVDAHAAGFSDVLEVADETVTDIGHGCGAEFSRDHAFGVWGLRAAMCRHNLHRRAEAAAEYGEPRGRPTQPSAHGNDIACTRS